jgi:GT2 family glycosyltransferase
MNDSVSVILPVFEDGERAVDAIRTLFKQVLPGAMSLQILVVDDGSRDDTSERILEVRDERVELLRLEENRGRSEACNSGCRRARSAYIVIIDSDCVPATARFLGDHIEALRKGAIASIGPVTGFGGGFWDHYQRDNGRRRERQFRLGHTYFGSTQNFAVLRSAFEQVGGFDAGYRNYGFEDRDLLLRLATVGDIVWTSIAPVSHMDALALQNVCRKMTESGRCSAERFAAQHPAAYRKLGYAAFDCRRRAWLRPVAKLIGPHMAGLAGRLEPVLHARWIPYPLRKGIVKLTSALSFLYGTALAGS